jgi:hypothetical protein
VLPSGQITHSVPLHSSELDKAVRLERIQHTFQGSFVLFVASSKVCAHFWQAKCLFLCSQFIIERGAGANLVGEFLKGCHMQ